MKKILVVIDNVIQYEGIKQIFEKYNRIDIEINFCHSTTKTAIWEHQDFVDGTKKVDVLNDVAKIIAKYDLVFSVHCLQFFPKELVQNLRCINIHPGYNPINRGWYPQVFAIIHNLPIGATIHEMDEKLDNGPIIARKFVEKHDWDTSYSIYERVLKAELELFDENFDAIIDNKYTPVLPESKGNFYVKKDFENLCKIDMNEVGTFKQFYDKARALSHNDFKNAYFINDEGKKIFFKVEIGIENE